MRSRRALPHAPTRGRRALVVAALFALVLGACGGGHGGGAAAPAASTDTTQRAKAKAGRNGAHPNARGKDCSADMPASVKPAQTTEVSGQGVTVAAAVYPHPAYEGRPWSQWGQGLVDGSGTFISAIGDHCGRNGNSYLYGYDPGSKRLQVIGNMRAATHQEPGAWGYGKIHGRLVAGPGGAVYGATYWGSHTNIAFDHGYDGDVLFRVDAEKGTIEPLGVPVPKQGIPSLASAPARGLIYGESVDPTANEKQGTFFAYDVTKRKVVFSSDTPEHDSFRSIAVDKAGKAYFSAGNNQLWVYDPDANSIAKLPARMPGVLLRAATAPAPDGTIYAATREPDALFALQPSGAIKELGPLPGYVASLGLDPDGSRVFYVPDAHGKAWEKGTPLMAVDTASGKSSEVVKLQALLGDKLGLVLGGSYDVVVSPDGRHVFVGLNGGPDQKTTFGSVVLADVTLPARP